MDTKRHIIAIQFGQPADKQDIEDVAKSKGEKTASWARRILVAEARRILAEKGGE